MASLTFEVLVTIASLCQNPRINVQQQCQKDLITCIQNDSRANALAQCVLKAKPTTNQY